ncbi:MAG TPA: hypothetical protein PLD95_04705 [bacterium]|jgi:hypothetical protein|nr:hypothetical protein [bacterium]HOG38736.1 hypothetical protein [bacterium]HQI03484.1 hypothetical protein [bacterium]
MSTKIEKILIPQDINFDSIVTLCFLYNYGTEIFSNLSKAEIEFRASLPSDKEISTYIKNGILPVIPITKEFALQELMSYEDLKLDDHVIVNHFLSSLKYFKKDKLGENKIFLLENIVEIFKNNKNPEKVIKIFLPIMKELIEYGEKNEKTFFEYCKEAVKDGLMTSFIVSQDNKELKVVFIEYKEKNPDYLIEYLFFKKEVMADVVVVFGDRGSIIIKAKIEKNIDLLDVIAILRVETARKNKVPFDKINKHILNRAGVMSGVEHWEFNIDSFTITSLKPTRLDKSNIKRALLIGIDLNKMAKGMCPSKEGCIGKKCDFYSYNMLRCRKRRAGVSDNFEQKSSKINNIRVYKK